MAKTRGNAVTTPARANFKRGPIPKSVKTQADMYKNDKASAFGKIRGSKGSMGNS